MEPSHMGPTTHMARKNKMWNWAVEEVGHLHHWDFFYPPRPGPRKEEKPRRPCSPDMPLVPTS